jgi:hypothetical protein
MAPFCLFQPQKGNGRALFLCPTPAHLACGGAGDPSNMQWQAVAAEISAAVVMEIAAPKEQDLRQPAAKLLSTLTRVFGEMQSHPVLICSCLLPFC